MESHHLSWFLILIALVLGSVSLASNEWSMSNAGAQKMGLWKECIKSSAGNYVCFSTRDSALPAGVTGTPLSDAVRQKILFLRIAASVSVVLLLLALFSCVFHMHFDGVKNLGLVSLILSVVISIVVLIVWATDKSLGKVRAANQSLGLGWYLQLVSMIFAGIVIVMDLKKHNYEDYEL